MSASGRTPRWKRILIRFAPFLFKRCPAGNNHWRTDRLCHCRRNSYCEDWYGGIYEFATGKELQTPQKLLVALFSLASWALACAVLKWLEVVKAIKGKVNP